jgi:hypothetical protein
VRLREGVCVNREEGDSSRESSREEGVWSEERGMQSSYSLSCVKSTETSRCNSHRNGLWTKVCSTLRSYFLLS